jgi:hypothetical protein
MADATLWMPSGMDEYAKQEYVDLYPDDPHMQAAAAWEDWAAQQDDPDPDTMVASMSTGVQSVSYAGPRSARGQAMERANWHRARANAASVPVGPEYAVASEEVYLSSLGYSSDVLDENNEALWSPEVP